MNVFLVVFINIGIVSFLLGWLWSKRKRDSDSLITNKIIANLKATIEIYKNTHEQQVIQLSQKYTDLKIIVLRLSEENKLLKEEIKKLTLKT